MVNSFIHFRTQSSYSMLESSIKVDQLVGLASSNQMPAVCLADRGNLFASLEFSVAAAKKNIQPIHGSIVKIKYMIGSNAHFADILLIAKDQTGYQNLLKLISYTFTQNDRKICNHITFEDLEKHHQGLIILSAYSEGIIGQLLLAKKLDEARKYAHYFKNLVGDRFYFEIMRRGYAIENQIEKQYLQIATDLQIPLIATNEVLFSDVKQHDAHDVLMCISAGVVQEENNRRRVSNQCYFKNADEMCALFSDLPEAVENTVHLAKRCYVRAQTHPPSLPNFAEGDSSEEELFYEYANKGLEKRLAKKEETGNKLTDSQRSEYFERLNYELGIICKMQFAGYFLIVADFINWSKQNDIAVGPGRGSGAGSIIAWALGITDLDPIEFGLLFERFLNPERVSMPDFDIDFCQERREEVISYVRSKYGDDRVAQIITFGKMQAKAVIKDVSRVLGLKYVFADYLTELVPFNAINPVTLKQAVSDIDELKQAHAGKGLYNLSGEEELIKQVLETSLILEGLHRHASTHAAGIVIANQPLTDTVAVYRDTSSEMLVIQYSMKYAELAGLVKFDFLGLQTLTLITKTLDLIKKSGKVIDMDTIPLDDKITFDMLSQGLSTGVFQLESVGMKNALRKLCPDSVDDIIALGALYRPGPMDNIPTYIACKHQTQEADYLHPILEPILRATYGVIIYQEQVMEIARRLSGYSLGAADLLRRAMGKKVKSEMDAQREIFVSGAVKNGVDKSQANSIFDTVAKFAGYGFNKSHASAYGVISYQTAYLKANYSLEFFVACLNLEMDSSDKINMFLQDAKNFGIEIEPPDINLSSGKFSAISGDQKKIVFAIGAIKNVSISLAENIEQIRKKLGDFTSISDFVEKIPAGMINRRALENMIKAGCFDRLHDNRAALIKSIPKIMAYGQSYHHEKHSQQLSLISVDTVSNKVVLETDDVFNIAQKADLEFDVLGLYLRNHPLVHMVDALENMNIRSSKYIRNELENGSSKAKLFGIITKKDARMSQRGRFVNLILSEPGGNFEVTIFNEEVLKDYAHLINVKTPVVVQADIMKDGGSIRITGSRFASIEEELRMSKQEVDLYASNLQDVEKIINLLQNNSEVGCRAWVNIYVRIDGCFMSKIDLGQELLICHNIIAELKKHYS